MALTSITKDFVVKSGIRVEGTSTVSSSTGQIGTLQVDGGAAIAKNLIVGTTATVYGPAGFLGTVNVVGQSTLGALTATVFTATSAHIIGDAAVDGSVITTLVTSTSYLVLGAGGTSNNVEIQTNGHATQFLAAGQIRPSGMLMGSSYDSNQIDVTNIGPLLLKGLAYGIELTTSPNTSSTYVWSYGTDGTLTNPGNVIVQSIQQSTSSNSGALTVAGGAGINGALNVGNTIYANSTTLATVSGEGALVVTGGEFIGGNLIVASTATNTSTNFSNALYVEGGAWIDKNLTVGGPTTFRDTVTFNGTATYVYSTQTYYTDNLIELHVPPTGVYGQWTVDDGKDIGFRFHYFANSTDTNAALVLSDSTKYLEWFSSGAESTSSVFSSATYGTFKTGNIYLTGTGDASSTITGSLQLVGGAGIGGNLYVGAGVSATTLTARSLATATNNLVYADVNGQLQTTSITFNGGTITGTITSANTATNLSGGARGSLPYQDSTGTTVMLPIGTDTQVLTVSGGVPTWASASGTTVGNASNAVTATNIASGLANQIPYQQSPGKTIFSSGLTFNGTVFTATNVVVNSGNNATTSTGYSGALMVQGGVGISQDLWVGGDVNIGGNLYFKGVGADTITSSTGTFVDILVTGTGVALVVTDSASVGKNLQVGGVFTATTLNVTGQTTLNALTATVVTATSLTVSGQSILNATSATAFTATSINVSGTLNVNGASTLQALTATVFTATSSTIIGNESVGGTFSVVGQSTLGALTATVFTATSSTIIGNESVGGTFSVVGQSTLGALTATVFTATSANIIGAETVGGILTVNNTTDSSLTTNGAVVVGGGVGVAKSMTIGGSVTIGSSITSSTVAAIYSNNSLYSSFTSGVITNNAQKTLDSFSSTAYRTAKYLIQIVDGTKIHIEEMLVFHDSTYVYITEYGIATTNGELGTFDAVIGGGSVTLNFTPNYTPTAMTIKVVRTSITF